MNESTRLADQLRKALNGDAWHGPSWREVLDGVRRDAAIHRPVPEAHTIAEVVLHVATWNDVVRRRVEGETPQVTDAGDWPRAAIQDDGAWEAAKARLFETGEALVRTVAGFPAERLHDKRPETSGTWHELVIGQLQHVLYHAGQVSLLRKALVPATV